MLPSSYLPDSVGGTEMYVHHLASALAARGHEIRIVHPAPKAGVEVHPAYEVVRLPLHQPRNRAQLYLKSCNTEPAGFGELLDKWRPDVIHFHAYTLGSGPDHARAARQRGIPYVVTYHTPTMSCQRGTLLRWGTEACDGLLDAQGCAACTLHGLGWHRLAAQLLGHSPLSWRVLPEGPWMTRIALPSLIRSAITTWREFMGGAERVIACADWCRELLRVNGLPPEQVTVIRQGLAGTTRQRRLRLPVPRRQPIRLGFFGRIHPNKGPKLLLQAAQLLKRQGMDVRCELLGPLGVSERPWFEQLLAPLAGVAVYGGVRQGSELTAWLAGLDLVAIPSRWMETGPLTLLESWDQGTPAVGSNLGGIREFMVDAGMESLLFAPHDPQALVEAILRAVNWRGSPQPVVSIAGMDELAERMEAVYSQSSAKSVASNRLAPAGMERDGCTVGGNAEPSERAEKGDKVGTRDV
jgi:glycosyltransferase involved in cell wall biosynthesis